ncbi:hypothetical protein L9G74_21640, partial [Shewanella sp. C32]
RKLVAVDPMESSDHGQAGGSPPAVTDILELLGTSVQTTVVQLSFTQPAAKAVLVNQIYAPGNRQCPDAG